MYFLKCRRKKIYNSKKDNFRIIDSGDMNAVKCSCQCNDEFYCNSWTFSGKYKYFFIFVQFSVKLCPQTELNIHSKLAELGSELDPV